MHPRRLFTAGIPFFVAAPCTTLDAATPNGGAIRIEERPAEELTHARSGERVVAEGIAVWNPSFDVTPASLITVRGTAVILGSVCVCDARMQAAAMRH